MPGCAAIAAAPDTCRFDDPDATTLEEMAARIERVLTNDPGTGVARHVDAGYPEAIDFARKSGVKVPML